MKQTKELYVSPRIEVIEMENEGVIASSNLNLDSGGYTPETWSRTSPNRSSASNSDLEDMINDILQVNN